MSGWSSEHREQPLIFFVSCLMFWSAPPRPPVLPPTTLITHTIKISGNHANMGVQTSAKVWQVTRSLVWGLWIWVWHPPALEQKSRVELLFSHPWRSLTLSGFKSLVCEMFINQKVYALNLSFRATSKPMLLVIRAPRQPMLMVFRTRKLMLWYLD